MPLNSPTKLRLLLIVGFFLSACSADRTSSNNIPANINRVVQTSGPIKYSALGDSTGAGVGARGGGYVARLFKRILEKRPESTLLNLCVSGATTEDVLRHQLDRAISSRPTLITLGIGINDIGHQVPLASFAENYEKIVSRLTSETDAPLVITNIPDTSVAPRLPEFLRPQIHERILQFNQKINEIAARHGATVVDVYEVTHRELPVHPEYFSADGFHPSDAGYEVWAEQMWPFVAEVSGISS